MGEISNIFEGVGLCGDVCKLIFFVDVCSIGEEDMECRSAEFFIIGNEDWYLAAYPYNSFP